MIPSERRITLRRAPLVEPFGLRLFEISTAFSPIRVASYTTQALPCIKHKQLAAKTSYKVQQTLASHSYGAKVARLYSSRNKDMVSAMLFVDPINPRDVEIIEIVDPKDGVAANNKMQQDDIKQGVKFGWCLIKDIWDKSPALGIKEIGDIPMTLIAGVKRFKEPKRLFDTDKARQLWGEYQMQWANQFPRSKVVMANKSGHFVQDDEPDLVVSELISLLKRTK